MTCRKPLGVVCVITLALAMGSTAESQEARQGTFKGNFGPRFTGTVTEIEKGHVFYAGAFAGVFFNDVAGGFIDKSSVECPGINDVVNGLGAVNHGYCIVTDKDGDKAFLKWQGKDSSPGVGGGDQHWIGGTGKYTGLTGKTTYKYAAIGTAPAFSVVWEGEWKLP